MWDTSSSTCRPCTRASFPVCLTPSTCQTRRARRTRTRLTRVRRPAQGTSRGARSLCSKWGAWVSRWPYQVTDGIHTYVKSPYFVGHLISCVEQSLNLRYQRNTYSLINIAYNLKSPNPSVLEHVQCCQTMKFRAREITRYNSTWWILFSRWMHICS